MKLLDWLRRLGIFRFGAEAAVYRNAKERPMSLQMDSVFDSKKDVIDLDEIKASPSASKKPLATELVMLASDSDGGVEPGDCGASVAVSTELVHLKSTDGKVAESRGGCL